MANEVEIVVSTKRTGTAFQSLASDVAKAKADFRELESAAKIDPSLDTKINVDDSELIAAGREIDELDSETITIPVDVEQPDASGALASLEDQFAGIDLSDMGGAIQGQIGALLSRAGPAGAIIGAAAAALGDDIMAGIADGMQARGDRIAEAIRFGMNENEFGDIGAIAGSAWVDGFGESTAEIRNVSLTLQQELGAIDDNFDLENATRQAQTLSDVFGVEIPTSINVARRLVATDMVRDTEQAFDLMVAAGQQFNLNQHELLDVVNEFSPVFAKLGIDGATAFGTIGTMVQEGLLVNVDRAAELFEEFNVRLQETDTLRRVITNLGLDFEQMQAKLAEGRGQEVLQEITRALLDMEDPARRDAAAIEIFGTAIESAADPERVIEILNQADALDHHAGAAQRAADAAEELQSGWATTEREVRSFTTGIGEAFDRLIRDTNMVWDEYDRAMDEMVGANDRGARSFDTTVLSLEDMNGELMLTADVYQATGREADDLASAQAELTAETERLEGALQSLSDWADTSGEAALRRVHAAADELTDAFTENMAASFDLQNGWDLTTEAGRAGSAMMDDLRQDAARLTAEFLNGEVGAREFTAAQHALESSLRAAAAAAGVDEAAVEALIDDLFRVPADVQTEVVTHTAEANNRIAELNARLDGIDGKTVNTYTTNSIVTYYRTVTTSVNSGGVQRTGGITGAWAADAAHDGGIRPGGLTLVGEEGPELVDLAPGSNVRSTPDTNTILSQVGGGQGLIVNNYIQGSILTERDLEDTIRGMLFAGAFEGVAG